MNLSRKFLMNIVKYDILPNLKGRPCVIIVSAIFIIFAVLFFRFTRAISLITQTCNLYVKKCYRKYFSYKT